MAKRDMPHFANIRDGELVKFAQPRTPLAWVKDAAREAAGLLLVAWRGHG